MRTAIMMATVLSLGAGPLHGQGASAAAADASVGTIVVAHGGSDDWNAPVLQIAEQAATGGPVEVSFLMGDAAPEYRFQDAAARLVERGATRIVVVPLLASSHSGHYDQIRYLAGEIDDVSETMMHHLHMAGIERPDVQVPIRLTRALDASMEIATILSERALDLATDPGEQALFIVGHGPNSAEDHAGWMDNLRPVADSVAQRTGFRDVKLGLLRDDAPAPVRAEAVRGIREVIALQHQLTGRDVVVVPILISKGFVSTRKLPADLEGLPVAYDAEGLLPHPALASWIARRVADTVPGFASHGAGEPIPDAAREVTITMSEFHFSASQEVFEPGVAYRFILKNVGEMPHEWAVVPRGAEDESELLFEVEEDDLPPGATVTRDFTFPEAGEYDFACFMPAHYEGGMVLPVTVSGGG